VRQHKISEDEGLMRLAHEATNASQECKCSSESKQPGLPISSNIRVLAKRSCSTVPPNPPGHMICCEPCGDLTKTLLHCTRNPHRLLKQVRKLYTPPYCTQPRATKAVPYRAQHPLPEHKHQRPALTRTPCLHPSAHAFTQAPP
jgi:hypothetical protein